MRAQLFLIVSVLMLTACTGAAETHTDHDAMTMDDMNTSLAGKTGDDLDKAFIEAMIPHHEGAIDMAETILNDAKHPELRSMAEDIIRAQEAEITQMKNWYEEWGYGSL